MDIVEELRTNRENGAKRLEAEYKAGLMTLARRFCNNPSDAEELVNRTFAAVVAGIDDFLEQSSFFTWMCQILSNINSMDNRRLANKDIVYPGVLPNVADEDAQEAIYRDVDASLLRDAVDRMPKEMRNLLIMHYFMDMPVAQMAKLLVMPVGTVMSKLYYARKALAARLGVKANEAVKKPGTKATLVALALCATAALGAVWWGELSERAAGTGSAGVVPRAAAIGETGETSGSGGSSPVAPVPTPVSPGSPVPPVITQSFSSEETNMNKTTLRTAALGAATALALASAPSAASADGYQYLIGPAGWSLETATLEGTDAARSTPPGALDVREHVVARSRAMSLTSIKNGATVICIR
jgi:RNA polymerase sigma-70 factor (ECF subfamily)